MTRAAVFFLAAGVAWAQTVSLTVNTGNLLHTIDPKIYGQFLENGDVWGEVVRDRGFEGPRDKSPWRIAGAAEILLDTNVALNGKQYVRMLGESRIEQAGLAVRAGDTLRGSLSASGTGPGLSVRLVDGGKVLAEQMLEVPGAEWREFPLVLSPRASAGNATLRIEAPAHSDVKVDQVSLMADSARANGGFRADATKAMAALRPPILRWMSERWKEGIGPQAKRAEAFGVDELVALGRKVGAEPVIVVPAAKPARYLQDAADLVEYCNGGPESNWGKIRKANGHADAYRVKYFEVDGAPEDLDVQAKFVAAMKTVDRSIRAIGSDRAEADLDYLSVPQHEKAGHGKQKLFVSAWDAKGVDGLKAGEALNAMERDAAVGMASAAHGLTGPAYAVMKLYRDHFAPDLLETGGNAGDLDVTVTRTSSGDKIYLKLVNSKDRDIAVDVALRGDFPLLGASMQVAAAGRLGAETTVERSGMSARFTLPRWSVAVVTLYR